MQKVVILGTGGTIAGTANDPSRAWAYQAAQLSVAQLIEAVPALQGVPLEAVQVAQVMGLTSVRPPLERVAIELVRMLRAELAGAEVDSGHLLEPTLVVR